MRLPCSGCWLALLLLLPSMAVFSQQTGESNGVCDSERRHDVVEGETLADIALAYYEDARKWTAIYTVNGAETGDSARSPNVGARLRIPCLDLDARTGGRPTVNANAGLKLLTAGMQPPYVDRDLVGGGLVTEIVAESLVRAPAAERFSLTWIDQRERHLRLLMGKRYDLGFPWIDPGCKAEPRIDMCQNFHFSMPLLNALVLLFVHRDAPINYHGGDQVAGLRLCRPADHDTGDLDRPGRRWLQRGLIRLVSADSAVDCFDRLAQRTVDAVAIDEFAGRLAVLERGLGAVVETELVPLSVQPLHAIVSRTHRRGTTILYRFNEGLRRFKAQKAFYRVVDRHLSAHWRRVGALPPSTAPVASTPASSHTPQAETGAIPASDTAIESGSDDGNR